MTGEITFGSLFAGIGGIDLGLERAGMVCVFQVEINDFCQKVLAKHWPEVSRFADIRGLSGADLPRADVLAGGFPCQDLSSAGKKAGIYGEKSGLWAEFARLVCEIRPRAVIVENVPGLLVSGMARVLGDLAELGYDAQWDSISAHSVGAPHIRDRVFIQAYRRDTDKSSKSVNAVYDKDTQRMCTSCPVSDADGDELRQQRQRDGKQQRKPGAVIARGYGSKWRAYTKSKYWEAEPGICRVVDGLPNRMDRVRALGNAVVPQCAEIVGRQVMEMLNA
jgi:DNA (cytosine-5)-methyltransferase 1